MKKFWILFVVGIAFLVLTCSAEAAEPDPIDPEKFTRGISGLLFLLLLAISGIVFVVTYIRKKRLERAGEVYVLSGVGGWLLFFVLITGLRVLRELLSVSLAVVNTSPDVALTGLTLLAPILFYNLALAHGLWSICKRGAGAVPYIKKLLILMPVLYAILPVYILAVTQLTEGTALLTWDVVSDCYGIDTIAPIVGSAIFSAIWYAYFHRSRRVKNTWSAM